MTKHRKVISGEIEDTVTEIGNSSHVYLPKTWIGKTVIVKIKEAKR